MHINFWHIPSLCWKSPIFVHFGLVADIVVLGTEWQISPRLGFVKSYHPWQRFVTLEPILVIYSIIPRYFRDSSVHSGRKTHSGCYLPMTSENINAKQSRKVTSSDRFICNLHIFRKEWENHIEGGTRKPNHRVHGFDINDCAILVIDYKSWTLGWDSL